MHATDLHAEAERLMNVCNSCRYCEGLCPVFPAMELRRSFADGDLEYLANLCHNCGACHTDCQFAPPHAFAVNVPQTLAKLRNHSYEAHAWPAPMRGLFARHGLWVVLALMLAIAAFLAGVSWFNAPGAILSARGDFYDLVPHEVMAGLFGAISAWVALALGMGVLRFWRASAGPTRMPARAVLAALGDVLTLKHLDGGGAGCTSTDEALDDRRRLYHHLIFYGFLLSFAATGSGTLMHYLFDLPAPYGLLDLPKLLGVPGGIALMVGTGGLMVEKRRRAEKLYDASRKGMDQAFILMLFLTAATGLALAGLRATPAMGLLLCLHLGTVAALFLSLPYGKFVHVFYRLGALLRAHAEARHP